jgi:cytochrome c oxidase cbb3-type subunit 2
MFGVALSLSMAITLVMPSFNIIAVGSTATALDKQLSYADSGFSLKDPFLKGIAKPVKVVLKSDPATGAAIEGSTYAYVYEAGTPFPSGISHPQVLGKEVGELSKSQGRIDEANVSQGAVFLVKQGELDGKAYPYIENATATQGWTPEAVLEAADDSSRIYAGAGRQMFVREGCWWCHTLLPEQTQDFQVFGPPPLLGDFNGESPTSFGSDRKAPDLLHVGSRNSSKEWMTLHFFNPRLVQPHSIMPRFDYLWGATDAAGNKIDYGAWRTAYLDYRSGKRITPPEVPVYRSDSEIRYLIDFVLNLK